MQQIDFWKKVAIKSNNECWEWLGCKHRQGYGRYRLNKKIQLAHRYAFMYHHNLDSLSDCILHSCDNTSCCNPHHLRQGTQKENIADRVARGRTSRRFGKDNPSFGKKGILSPIFGIKRSRETIEKHRANLKEGHPMFGCTKENNGMFGKKHTEETKSKISQSKKPTSVSQY